MSPPEARRRDAAFLGLVGALVCCGVPLLMGAGAGVVLAGIGVRSWLLVLAGVVAVIAGFMRWRVRAQDGACTYAPGS